MRTYIEQAVKMIAMSKGWSCYKYILFLLEKGELNDSDLDCLFLILTGRQYSDGLLDTACFMALNENIRNFDSFEQLLDEVYTSFHDSESLAG